MFHVVADYLRSKGWTSWNVLQLRSTNGIVWWIFRPGEAGPRLIAKCHMTAADVLRGKHEAHTLQLLQTAIELGIPQLEFTSSPKDDLFYSLQAAVPGKPWKDELGRDDAGLLTRYVDRIGAWIFQFQTRVRTQISLAQAAEQLRHQCSDLQLSAEEERLFSTFAGMTHRLESIPAAAAHGDLWPGNVLEAPGKISVIDWATFHYGSPLEDLHSFIVGATYRHAQNLDTTTDELWKLFFGGSHLTRLLETKTVEHLNRLNLSKDLIQPLFLMFLIHRLAYPEFRYHQMWRNFACRYIQQGMPTPFAA